MYFSIWICSIWFLYFFFLFQTRIDIACLELFGDIDMFDSNIRARRLIEMLSFKDIVNQPHGDGWWDSFNNYSFEDLVSFIADVPDPSVPHIYDSKILNNQCGVCFEYYHKNKVSFVLKWHLFTAFNKEINNSLNLSSVYSKCTIVL